MALSIVHFLDIVRKIQLSFPRESVVMHRSHSEYLSRILENESLVVIPSYLEIVPNKFHSY